MPRPTGQARSKAKAKTAAKPRARSRSDKGGRRSPASKGMVLVTGASRGIGAELAKQFAQGGHDLVLVARNAGQLLELATAIRDDYGRWATTVALDLGEPGAAQKLYQQLRREDIEIDVLVNNAGLLDNGEFTAIPMGDHLQLIDRARHVREGSPVTTAEAELVVSVACATCTFLSRKDDGK